MKQILLSIACTFCCLSVSLAQGKSSRVPFIISGRLSNCPENKLILYSAGDHYQSLADTIRLDKEGNFYLKTYGIQYPQQVSIQQNAVQINALYAAPGYRLTITGEGSDVLSLLKTKRISGAGAESNAYLFLLDSIYYARMDRTPWYELNEQALLAYIKRERHLRDSVASEVFSRTPIHDRYFSYFQKMAKLDNAFMDLTKLLTYVNMNRYNYAATVALVNNNTDKQVLQNICKEEYLLSEAYRSWIISNEYLRYLVKLDCLKDSTLCNRSNHALEIVSNVYTGHARAYTLYSMMHAALDRCRSLAELSAYKQQFAPYSRLLTNPAYQKDISKQLSAKETELISTQIGQPAPKFTLPDTLGNTHSLDDYKGKVVYLDLWASWCSPCRAETPFFKSLYNKYKTNEQVAFISIAVHDGVKQWKKAIAEDEPLWTQLIDDEGLVWKSYVANTIPQFILIDKQGNIINFDAARPSSGKEVEALLNQAIAK